MPEETEVVETPVVETPAVEPVVVNKQWFDEFEPDLKANPSITKFKSPAEIAKSYVELQKTLGKDKVVVPTEKSTPGSTAGAATTIAVSSQRYRSRR